MFSRLRLVFLVLTLCISFSQQVDKSVYVTADSFVLNSEESILVLSNNVQIQSYVYHFKSDLAKYYTEEDVFRFYDDFSILYKGQVIEGKDLILNNKNKMMTANNVIMDFDKYSIHGDVLRTVGDEYHLDDVKVTACDGDPPIFYMRSGQMVIYPKIGFMVVFNSILYFYDVPIFYFPAYFMGGHKYGDFSELIPEIGSNAAEGNYVKERIPYYIDSVHSGTFFLGYLEKMGMKTGLDHFMILNDQNMLNLGIYYNPKFLQGGAEYSYEFFEHEKDPGYLLWYLFDKENVDRHSLKFKAKYYKNELINDWFVDQEPRLSLENTFRVDDNNILKSKYEHAELDEWDFNKKTNAISWRRQLKSQLFTELRFGAFIINNELGALQNDYQTMKHSRSWDTVMLSFPYNIFHFSVGSEYMLALNGTSPFMHDMYEVSNENNMLYNLQLRFPYFTFEFDMKQKWSGAYYHRKYIISLPFQNCVDFSFSYDDIKDDFSVVFKM